MLENTRLDDDLRQSIDRLNNLRFIEEEDRSQKLDLNNYRKPSTNLNYTNPNLNGIIKCNVINTPFSHLHKFPHLLLYVFLNSFILTNFSKKA